MRTVIKKTYELEEGQIVAKDIYNAQIQLLIGAGCTLTEREIARLVMYGIDEIAVKILDDEEAQVIKPPKENSYEDVALFYAFKEGFDEATKKFKSKMQDIFQKGEKIEEDEMLALVNDMIPDEKYNARILDMLKNMRDGDDVIFAHSLCVALMCRVFGQWLGWSERRLDTLIISALLHDVGKMEVPSRILNKQGVLSDAEYTEIKKHPVYAYKILKDQEIDEQIKKVALMHHERNDGSGYPRGLREEQIDDMAAIVAIVDVFDAMTCNRPYRKGICPFVVIDILLKEGNTKFNYIYLHKFLERIAFSYMHERVKLSNGMEGEVVAINDRDLSRPLVRANGNIIDLSTNRDIYITDVITKLSVSLAKEK